MQPPPRKMKESQQVKLVFSEQLSKLQNKHHQETELLEDIRSFSKQRAAIEKEYAQALQRLAVQYQRRDWQRGNTEAVAAGSFMFGVWRSVVDAAAHTSASRLAAAEEYRLLGEASTALLKAKDVRAKRGLERLQRAQAEVVDALRELHKMKKSYHQVGHVAAAARGKAADAHNRARRSEPGIFHFKSGQQKAAKLSARLTECDGRLTDVRNQYLLTLAAVNAHQQHFYTHDLPHIMEQMDGDIYEDLKRHFSVLCGTEMDACESTHQHYSRTWDGVVKVSRDRNVQQFLQESVSFSKAPEFTFQPAPHDQVSSLQEVRAAEGFLVTEAKKWVAKAAKDDKSLSHGETALRTLGSRLKLLSRDTGLSVEQKMEEVQESIRKAQLGRVKAEARLALLSLSVTGTDLWLHQATSQAEEDLERERRRSAEDACDDDFELTDFEDHDSDSGDVSVYPAACRVVFSYQAGQSDELSVTEGEELQVVEDGDMEDWLKVCNSCGQVGYVPERYVQYVCLPVEGSAHSDGSFSSTCREETASSGVARALYPYQAQSAEELSFQEGALITLIRCGRGEVDDGFWMGELNGQVGVFPSLVVELVHDVGEEEKQGEEVKQGEEPLPTPSTPPFSAPACGSAPSAAPAPPGCVQDNTADTADGSPSRPPGGRLRPVCAVSRASSSPNTEAVKHVRNSNTT